MKISLNWINEFTPINKLDSDELANTIVNRIDEVEKANKHQA